VFLANEYQPLILDRDDRRYAVVHTPEKLDQEFYQQVRDEINAGGIAALHDYLLHVDLGDFDEHTKPPMTRAKRDLIEVSMDSVQRFLLDWQHGEIELGQDRVAPFVPCHGSHLFSVYRKWCDRSGERSPRSMSQFVGAIKSIPRWRAGQSLPTYTNLNNTAIKNRKMVIPPDELMTKMGYIVTKDGKTQQHWLTECFFKFANEGDFDA